MSADKLDWRKSHWSKLKIITRKLILDEDIAQEQYFETGHNE